MLKTNLAALTALATAAVLTPLPAANAADLGRPKPTYAVPDERIEPLTPALWRGTYVGIAAGYGWGDSTHNYDRNDNHGTANLDLEGALASLTLGYNYLLTPGFLIGVEADLGFMDVRGDDKVIFDGHIWKSQFGGLWGTARARAGFIWDRVLIYGTGGVAFMQLDEVGYGDAAGQTATNTDYRAGWVVGGGMEYALSSRVSTKIEYLHMDFGRYDGLSENQETYFFDNKLDIIRAGISFKF